jgi:hypothetical protein
MEPVAAFVVAKKKPKPGPGDDSPGADRKPMIVQVRGSAEFKDWAERLARFDNLPLATLVDRALRRYAKDIGFKDDAPAR